MEYTIDLDICVDFDDNFSTSRSLNDGIIIRNHINYLENNQSTAHDDDDIAIKPHITKLMRSVKMLPRQSFINGESKISIIFEIWTKYFVTIT